MSGTNTSDPWCNAVMARWAQAKAEKDHRTETLLFNLTQKHNAPTIDWRRVANDAGIDVPDPIDEARAIALQDALTALVNEAGKIVEHSGSTDFLAAYTHARALLGKQPDNWITQSEARTLFERLSALTAQVDRLLAAGIETNPSIFTAALRRRSAFRATSLEEPER